ncbi:MAG: hypothetical protein KJO69_03030, partial [Gammaproteobacteria bacterium]|nr:hypothetical protein [Gammaproteobacteria bacterium]
VVRWLAIVIVWAITFLKAVPLHAAIDSSPNVLFLARDLVRVNWSRTIIWTIIWILTGWQWFTTNGPF